MKNVYNKFPFDENISLAIWDANLVKCKECKKSIFEWLG
jgi:hypothetical protein